MKRTARPGVVAVEKADDKKKIQELRKELDAAKSEVERLVEEKLQLSEANLNLILNINREIGLRNAAMRAGLSQEDAIERAIIMLETLTLTYKGFETILGRVVTVLLGGNVLPQTEEESETATDGPLPH
jgi:uncharacterized iron-regulated protein